MQRGRFEANPAATAAARETTGSGYDQRPDRERDTQCGTGSARYIVTLLRGRWSVPAVDRRPSRPASRRPAVRTRRPTLTRRKLGVAHEELLKLRRRWNHRREEPGKRGANVLPRVRRAPRNEDERARRRLELAPGRGDRGGYRDRVAGRAEPGQLKAREPRDLWVGLHPERDGAERVRPVGGVGGVSPLAWDTARCPRLPGAQESWEGLGGA